MQLSEVTPTFNRVVVCRARGILARGGRMKMGERLFSVMQKG